MFWIELIIVLAIIFIGVRVFYMNINYIFVHDAVFLLFCIIYMYYLYFPIFFIP